jgi:hypothetical protein
VKEALRHVLLLFRLCFLTGILKIHASTLLSFSVNQKTSSNSTGILISGTKSDVLEKVMPLGLSDKGNYLTPITRQVSLEVKWLF